MELLAPIDTKLFNGAVSKLPILKSAKFQESQHFAQILGSEVLLNIKIESVPYVDCFKTIKAYFFKTLEITFSQKYLKLPQTVCCLEINSSFQMTSILLIACLMMLVQQNDSRPPHVPVSRLAGQHVPVSRQQLQNSKYHTAD